MPITTTLGQLAAAAPALGRLSGQALPIGPAYQVAKLAKRVGEEVDLFVAQRNAVIRELGEEHDDPTQGRVVQVKPEHTATYTARLQELAALETTLEATPLDLAALGAITITPADLLALDPLVVTPV